MCLEGCLLNINISPTEILNHSKLVSEHKNCMLALNFQANVYSHMLVLASKSLQSLKQ